MLSKITEISNDKIERPAADQSLQNGDVITGRQSPQIGIVGLGHTTCRTVSWPPITTCAIPEVPR